MLAHAATHGISSAGGCRRLAAQVVPFDHLGLPSGADGARYSARMKVGSGMAAAGFVVVLAVGCTAAGAGSTETPGVASPTASMSGVPSSTGNDWSNRYETALIALRNADTVTYSSTSVVQLTSTYSQREGRVSVDARKGMASTRMRIHADVGGKRTDTTVLVVTTTDAVFLNMPAWTGPRKGKWMRLTSDSTESLQVPFELTDPTTLPPVLEDFEATGVRSSGAIEGTVDALSGIRLFGLTAALKDPGVAASVAGRIPAAVTLDPASGAILKVEVVGEGHTVHATPESLPPQTLEQFISAASALVTIEQVGQPVTISVPPPKDVLRG